MVEYSNLWIFFEKGVFHEKFHVQIVHETFFHDVYSVNI